MPEWVRELAGAVRSDLETNRSSPDTSGEDFWGYSLKRRWTVEGAGLVNDGNSHSFTSVDLDIWCGFYPGRPEREHRYNIYAHSAGRSDRKTAQWGGTRSWPDPALPERIRELIDAQYEELAGIAAVSTAQRNSA
jgi:hypothetical protein